MAINKNKNNFTRFTALKGIVAGLFTIILLRVTYLQVFKYEEFKEKASVRSARFMAEKAPRGKIYDSNDNILATNKQTYTATFTETEASKDAFYRSMKIFFDVMNENGEKIDDKFDLVVNDNGELVFDFGFKSEVNNKAAELRFKKDKGIFEEIQNDLYPNQKTDLTDEQIQKIEEALYKVSAEDVFCYLIYKYDMVELLNEYKDRDINLSKDQERELKASIKDRYKEKKEEVVVEKKFNFFKKKEQKVEEPTVKNEFGKKVEHGKRVLNDLVKENSLAQIRQFMVVKDTAKMQSFSGFKPVVIAPSISEDTAFILYQKLNSLIGIDISLEPVRYYPYGELGANFLGYMGAIPSSSQNKYESRGYDLSTDLIGMAGIESAFETVLRGTKGGDLVKVNAQGRGRGSMYSLQTSPGNNVHLTIDKDIQYSAEKMLETRINELQEGGGKTKNASRGAAVALNVNTGEVLAMASYPTYDPNIFATGRLDGDVAKDLLVPDLDTFGAEYIKRSGIGKTVDELFPKNSEGVREDPNDIYPKPLFNYATMGLLPPGSTFKPITALVALEEGVMNAGSVVSDGAVLSGLNFVAHAGLIDTPLDNGFHGDVTVKEAIQRSCNSFFYETAVRLYYKYNKTVEGFDSIAKYAWQLGLGKDPSKPDSIEGTGIEIAERAGDVYSFAGSKDKFKTFSMWDFVSGLEKGQLNSGSQTFAPVDIERNDKDEKLLKEAKDNLKNYVKKEISKIESLEKTSDEKAFKKEITPLLQALYDLSPKYQETIKSRGSDLKIQFEIISTEIYNWINYNVKYQVVNPGNIASASIGQGDTNVTPLQFVSAMSTLINGGTRYQVRLVDKITTYEGEVLEQFEPVELGKLDASQENINLIKEGMYMTNHVPQGTAYGHFANFPIPSGGKTGTATLKADQETIGRQAYGTYIGFAPVENPEIAVFVVIYDADGGSKAAPVARAMMETYFRDEIKTKAPQYTPRTVSGDPYYYSLYPESEDFKDDGVVEGEKPPVAEENKIETTQKNDEESSNNDVAEETQE
ncbi:MAG: penicillin-binding transpeptidase domain-containing protein [Sarcina sp.]